MAIKSRGIGASEIGELLNIEWGCRRRLYYKKARIEPDFPMVETGAMKRGKMLEDDAVQEFTETTGLEAIEINSPEPFRHQKAPMIAFIDRLVKEVSGDCLTILEVKVPGFGQFKNVKENGLPQTYILQMQAELALEYNLEKMGIDDGELPKVQKDYGRFAVLHADSWTLLEFTVERNDKIISKIETESTKFWEDLCNEQEPDQLEFGDNRCKRCNWHKTCWKEKQEILISLPDQSDITDMSDNEILVNSAREFAVAKDTEKEAKKKKEELKEEIQQLIGDNPIVTAKGMLVTNKLSNRTSWDLESLINDHPELKEKYIRVTTQTRFNVKPRKGDE
ncbi:MAG: YqaJ viral recombinase family protein [bacterium]|nr:YqaJ viral recombinase family protein [bacterium]